jgi:DNA-binding transcriptional ArsR family regulator
LAGRPFALPTFLLVGCILLTSAGGNGFAQNGKTSITSEKANYIPGEDVRLGSTFSDLRAADYSLEWNTTLAGTMFAYSGRVATDGEYLYITAASARRSQGNVQTVKTDLNGTEIWNRTWGLTDDDFPINIILSNNTIYIVGASGDGQWPDPLFLLAYDENGNELWNRTWAGHEMSWGTGLVAVGDSLYISGWSWNVSSTIDPVLLKFNLLVRDFEWARFWDAGSDEYGEDIACLDGPIYMAIYDSAGSGYAGIVKYDLNGREIWNRTWDSGYDVSSICTDGTDLFVAGSRNVNGSHSSYIRFYTEKGDLKMERFFGESRFHNSFSSVRVRDGIAYCAGSCLKSTSPDSRDAFLVAFDTRTGTMLMNHTWGGNDEEICNGIVITDDSDIYCTGGTRSFNNGSWELFLLKYTNRIYSSNMPASFSVIGPDGHEYFNGTGTTDSDGNASCSFSLPSDAPEGIYECLISGDVCGTVLTNRTSFSVVWPWSPILILEPPPAQNTLQPGEVIPFRSYAGYEYHPARGKKPASASELSVDLYYPNGTLYFTIANTTSVSGWTNLSIILPKSTHAGNYTVRLRGFEGLRCESHLEVLNPAGQIVSAGDQAQFIPVAPVLGSASVTIIIIALVIAGTEIGKFGFLAPFAPLYSRIRRDKALDNRIRHQILGYLTENPGEHYTALKRALKLSNSVIVYHLAILEQGGFIRSRRDGTMKRFYPSAVKAPETRQRTPEELTEDILEAIAKSPGITRRELVERLVVSEEAIAYKLRKLAREGKVTAPKKGKTRVYYPVR